MAGDAKFAPPEAPQASQGELVAYRFGPYRLCLEGCILERDGERIRVTPKVVDTLLVLLRHAGEVVPKDQLIAEVWPDVVVVESGLTRNLSVLRQALREDESGIRYIETVPRRGYRFIADLALEFAAVDSPANMPPHSAESIAPPAGTRRWPTASFLRIAVPSIAAAALVFAALGIIGMTRGINGLGGGDKSGQSSSVRSGGNNPDTRIGRHMMAKFTPTETLRAREHFERAIVADPRSAEAHAGVALSLVQLSRLGMASPGTTVPQAKHHAEIALQLDASNSYAHTAAGAVHLLESVDLQAAARHFRLALNQEPDSVSIRSVYSHLLLAMGDLDGAHALVEEALRLDPASPSVGTQYGALFYFQRDYKRAAAELGRVLEREPGYALAHYFLALSQGFLGDFDEAERNLKSARLNPDVVRTDRAWLKAMQGDLRPAKELLAERRLMVQDGTLDVSANLLLACTLGEADEAIAAVESAIETRAAEMLTLHAEPRLDFVRSDSRYTRLKLPGTTNQPAILAGNAIPR